MFTLLFRDNEIRVYDWDNRRPCYLWGQTEFDLDKDLKQKLLDILENELPEVNEIGWYKNMIDTLGISISYQNNHAILFVCSSKYPNK